MQAARLAMPSKEKAHPLFNADAAGTQTTMAEDFGYALVKTFIFFPGANVFAHRD